MGKAMRATALDQDTAQLMGINVNVVISLTFAIGSALAAVGGMLIALDYKCYPTLGTMTGLKAFVAAVVGGIGKGAIVKLNSMGIKVYQSIEGTIEENVNSLKNGELKEFDSNHTCNHDGCSHHNH